MGLRNAKQIQCGRLDGLLIPSKNIEKITQPDKKDLTFVSEIL